MKGDGMATKKTVTVLDVTGFPVEYNLPENAIDPKGPTIDEIESFILECGQESTNGFGGVKAGGIYLQQSPDELAPCIAELLKYKDEIKSYLEVGSASGGSCFVFNHFFSFEKIVLIDNNGLGRQAIRNDVLRGIFRQELIGRSNDGAICDSVAKMGIMFDLIVLDSEHDYQNVKAESEIYLPFLRPGGFLFIHDTVFAPDGSGQAMGELIADGMELVAEYVSEKGPKLGIGLLRKAVA
jgi:cephalosporin hydroxylase